MEPGGGHLQRAFGVVLPADVGQVGVIRRLAVAVQMDAAVGEGFNESIALQVGDSSCASVATG